MDDRIKLKKVDHLKFFLTILGIIVFVIISSIFITAFQMGINNNHDFVLSGNTYFDETTTLVYRFFDDSGRLLAYEKNEDDESSTLIDNKSFTYVVDEKAYSVTLTFKDDEQTFYFINNALFDSTNNLYLYLLD